jgi:nitronate monooxygenase
MPLPPSLLRSLRLPAIAAPMFLSSGPALVVACARAGVIGAFPALNQRSSEGLDAWLAEIRQALDGDARAAAFAVNLIVHKSNPRLASDLALCVKHRVPLVITSLGAARDIVEAVHGYGGVVFHDVTNAAHARKAADAGVDGLILVAGGAGGHAGTWNPFALLGEVRRAFAGTIVLGGAVSSGSDIAAAQMMGADLAYMGTRFNATQESLAPPAYKQMLVGSTAADIVYTAAICTVPASFLRASIAAAGLDPDDVARRGPIDLSHVTEPYKKELEALPAKPWRDIWSAGQGVGAIADAPPAAALIAMLAGQYREAIAAFQRASAPFAAGV